MTYTKNEFDNLTREDRELHKFCQTPAGKIAIRMKGIAGRQYRDASDRELPEITPGEENSWVISVGGILPYLGIVNPGDYIIFDGTNRTKLDPTINTDETLEGNGTSSKPLTVVQNYLKLDQTTPQTTIGRFAFPNLAVDNDLIYTDSVNKRVGIGATDPTYKLDVRGRSAYDAINSNIGYNIQTLKAPIAPTATVGSGGSLSVGTYYYFVTYTTATGETNAGSVVKVTTTTGNQKVTLTNIPISSDPRVTGRKIYRTKVNKTYDDEYYLARIADNTTTTYIDTTADNSLTGLGVQYYKVNTTATQITLDNVRSLFVDNNLTTLGKSAGNSIITGNGSSIRSVFIGYGAGQKVTTGRANTVVGVAFMAATTASSCSILGDLAGYAITTGGGNTIIGAQAGRFLTTGSRNIMLGSGCAGYLNDNSTQLLNPTNCIYIGNNVKGLSSNETNSIVIGEGALGIGSNSVVLGNDSITKTALKGNVGIGTTDPTSKLSVGEKSAMNEVGGFMIKLTNKTGANTVKGEVVDIYSEQNNAVRKTVDGVPDAIGVFYESGIADGEETWVVISGIADIYFVGSTTRSHLARTFIAGETGYVTGQALSEAVPTSPFASDKHFCKIGHVLESRTGAGLAKCVLRFN